MAQPLYYLGGMEGVEGVRTMLGASYFRQWNNIQAPKASLKRLLMETHLKWKLQALEEQHKVKFLVLFLSDVHFCFEHLFFACPIGRASIIVRP